MRCFSVLLLLYGYPGPLIKQVPASPSILPGAAALPGLSVIRACPLVKNQCGFLPEPRCAGPDGTGAARRRNRPCQPTKLISCSARLGWRSFRRAFASIWRILSRVTPKSFPTSSSV